MKYIAILCLPIFLTACGKEFKDKNMTPIRTGMTTEQIQTRFGDPHKVSVTTCDTTFSLPKPCTIWQYTQSVWGVKISDTFTFYTDETDGKLYLKDFDINRY